MATEAEQIVTRFVAALERADVDELLDFSPTTRSTTQCR
jgi:hypothetical protein